MIGEKEKGERDGVPGKGAFSSAVGCNIEGLQGEIRPHAQGLVH